MNPKVRAVFLGFTQLSEFKKSHLISHDEVEDPGVEIKRFVIKKYPALPRHQLLHFFVHQGFPWGASVRKTVSQR